MSEIGQKAEEKNDIQCDFIQNPIKVGRSNFFNLDVRLDVNFKYKGLIEIIKNIRDSQEKEDASKGPKVIWIITEEKRRVRKIKSVINSYFSRKDQHKTSQLFKMRALMELLRGPVNSGNNSNAQNTQDFRNGMGPSNDSKV